MATKVFMAPIDQSERVLVNGRYVVPGTQFQMTDEEQALEHNARLIEERQILEVPPEGVVEATSASKSGKS